MYDDLNHEKSVLPVGKANKMNKTKKQINQNKKSVGKRIYLVHVCVSHQQMENTEAERDVYDELLTQAEIQGNVNKVNGESNNGRRRSDDHGRSSPFPS